MYSDWFDIEFDDELSNPTVLAMPIEEPLVSREFIADGGFVLMYFKVDTGDALQVIQLPWQDGDHLLRFRVLDAEAGAFIEDAFRGILFLAQSLDGTPLDPEDFSGIFQLRYILIPGGVELSGAAGIAWDDYASAMSRLSIRP